MIVPESSIITDDAEIIVKETELNVSLKGRTTMQWPTKSRTR